MIQVARARTRSRSPCASTAARAAALRRRPTSYAERRGQRAGAGRRARRADNGYAVALAWTGAAARGRTADALFGLDRAHDWDEFREAAPDVRRARARTSSTPTRDGPHRLPGARAGSRSGTAGNDGD